MDDNYKLQSRTISYLRFPLIVAIVFLHSYASSLEIQGTTLGHGHTFPIFENISYFISSIIARIAVPFFFLTSGFLFFLNVARFDKDVYFDKLKKRFQSLFIPYVFWISLTLLVFFIAQNIPYTAKFFSGNRVPLNEYSLQDFFRAYWASPDTGGQSPFLYTFWFIRDLMVIVVLSPAVYLIVKYLKLFGVTVLSILWFFNVYEVTGLSLPCSFFFTLGAYFSINKKNIIDVSDKLKCVALAYPAIAVADLLTRDETYNFAIHNIGILAGIFFFLYIVSRGIENNRLKESAFLSGASFFVFATHEPWLVFIRKLLYSYIQPGSEIAFISLYFVPALLIIGLSLSAYYMLSKVAPRFLSLISGGR